MARTCSEAHVFRVFNGLPQQIAKGEMVCAHLMPIQCPITAQNPVKTDPDIVWRFLKLVVMIPEQFHDEKWNS